eukprot:gene24357-30686_t
MTHNDRKKKESTQQFSRRKSIGGTPVYAVQSNRMKKQFEDEVELLKAKEREEKHRHKIGMNFNIIDSEGTRYVYDWRGMKVPESDLQPPKKKSIAPVFRDTPSAKFTGAIVEKTSKHVEKLRNIVEEDKRAKDVWVPGALPSTTVELKTPLKRSKSTQLLHAPHSLSHESVLPKHLITTHSEYALMEVGDVVVTVEHCCDCCDHDWITHHDEQQYED